MMFELEPQRKAITDAVFDNHGEPKQVMATRVMVAVEQAQREPVLTMRREVRVSLLDELIELIDNGVEVDRAALVEIRDEIDRSVKPVGGLDWQAITVDLAKRVKRHEAVGRLLGVSGMAGLPVIADERMPTGEIALVRIPSPETIDTPYVIGRLDETTPDEYLGSLAGYLSEPRSPLVWTGRDDAIRFSESDREWIPLPTDDEGRLLGYWILRRSA